MDRKQFEHIKKYSESESESDFEKQFHSNELQAYFDEKLKRKYQEKLDHEFNIRKTNKKNWLSRKSNRRLSYFALPVLAILIALAIYFYIINSDRSEQQLITAYKNELYTQVDFTVRGTQIEEDELKRNLIQAYEQRRFEIVVEAFENWETQDTEIPANIKQMAGIAYGSLENYDRATTLFSAILNTPESTYSNHSTVRYLQGLVFILNGKPIQAKEILQKIEPGQYKYSEVQEILSKNL